MLRTPLYLCAFAGVLFGGSAQAYETQVQTRSYSQKLATDDLVVVESQGLGSTNSIWFASQNNSKFQINLTNYSVGLEIALPVLSGMKTGSYEFQSWDRLHDLKPGVGGQKYNMRVFFNRDFTWIEVWPQNSNTAPVRSSAFFFGPDQDTYNYYMNLNNPYVRYANYNELKNDVQQNYANKYNPDAIGHINVRPRYKAAYIYGNVAGSSD